MSNPTIIEPNDIHVRAAVRGDADDIAACVDAAYRPYIERIGRPPGPMLEDYGQVIRECQVHVALVDESVAGVLVLKPGAHEFLADNVAVHPTYQGHGIGKTLMALADTEARRQGYGAITLYTHEKMTENQALYRRLGYTEPTRRAEQGYDRIYMRKQLA